MYLPFKDKVEAAIFSEAINGIGGHYSTAITENEVLDDGATAAKDFVIDLRTATIASLTVDQRAILNL